MLSLSAKSVYGLTALIELSSRYNSPPVQIRDIAAVREIPQHYLEQLLVTLRRAGIVESFRGARGGYALARPPSQISVADVLTALDGPLEIVPEKHRKGYLEFFWAAVEKDIAGTLSLSLEELLQTKHALSNQFTYNI